MLKAGTVMQVVAQLVSRPDSSEKHWAVAILLRIWNTDYADEGEEDFNARG